MNSTSENQVVTRGVKAIGLVHHLTKRTPTLIAQSHLEKNEGTYKELHLPQGSERILTLLNQLCLHTGPPYSIP